MPKLVFRSLGRVLVSKKALRVILTWYTTFILPAEVIPYMQCQRCLSFIRDLTFDWAWPSRATSLYRLVTAALPKRSSQGQGVLLLTLSGIGQVLHCDPCPRVMSVLKGDVALSLRVCVHDSVRNASVPSFHIYTLLEWAWASFPFP